MINGLGDSRPKKNTIVTKSEGSNFFSNKWLNCYGVIEQLLLNWAHYFYSTKIPFLHESIIIVSGVEFTKNNSLRSYLVYTHFKTADIRTCMILRLGFLEWLRVWHLMNKNWVQIPMKEERIFLRGWLLSAIASTSPRQQHYKCPITSTTVLYLECDVFLECWAKE